MTVIKPFSLKFYAKLRLLLDKGAEINAVCNDGNTALHSAVENNQIEAIEALLASRKIEVNIKNKDGHTPLEFAESITHSEAVEKLREYEKKKMQESVHSMAGSIKPFISTNDQGHTVARSTSLHSNLYHLLTH